MSMILSIGFKVHYYFFLYWVMWSQYFVQTPRWVILSLPQCTFFGTFFLRAKAIHYIYSIFHVISQCLIDHWVFLLDRLIYDLCLRASTNINVMHRSQRTLQYNCEIAYQRVQFAIITIGMLGSIWCTVNWGQTCYAGLIWIHKNRLIGLVFMTFALIQAHSHTHANTFGVLNNNRPLFSIWNTIVRFLS